MSAAWTCRLRTKADGSVAMWLAPAGGMGFSRPCCDAGHENQVQASLHGSEILVGLLTESPALAS